jgi:MFS family permease
VTQLQSPPPNTAAPSDHPQTTPGTVARKSPREMRRVGLASLVGTVVEFYDFNIYGTAAALVFPKIFFPALGPAAATIASFATLGVAFVARPFGSVVFGHFGDRLGRKKTLVATLLIMGVSTLLVGLMPTAAQIGVVAPILLILLRILQGLAAGGEWAGAALFAAESAPKAKRGFWAMMPSLGGGIANVLGSATFLVTALSMNDEAFAAYGWRIPFVGSVLLLAIGFYIRLKTEETPVFTHQALVSGTVRVPFLEVFKHQPRQLVRAAGLVVMSFAFVYVGVNYLASYGTAELHLSRVAVLAVGIAGGAALALGVLLGGVTSDRLGRRRVMLVASSVAVVWSLLLFPILNIGSVSAFLVGMVVTEFIAGVGLGPVGALMSELFHTRYRYTAAGLSYSIAGVIGGAVPPLIAVALTAAFGGFAFGIFLAALCLLSLVSSLLTRETREYELDEDAVRAVPALA